MLIVVLLDFIVLSGTVVRCWYRKDIENAKAG